MMHLRRMGVAVPVTAMMLLTASYGSEARTQAGGSDRQTGSDRQSTMESSSSRMSGEENRASPRSRSHWAQVSGEIDRMKKVSVRGTRQEHLAVLLLAARGGRLLVDLGPVQQLKDLELRSGDYIGVRGPVIRLNDRRVMFAKQLYAEGQRIQINRKDSSSQESSQKSAKPVSGDIQTVKELKVKGTGKTHQVVKLKTEDGQEIIADLGAKKDLRDLNIKTGQKLRLEGPMYRMSGKPFVMAEQISTDGRTVQIDREFMSAIPASKGSQEKSTQHRAAQSVRGEVIVKGEVLRVDRDGFYVVKDPSGRQVHLLVAEDLNQGFDVGDQIQAQVKPDGSVTAISKSSGDSSGGSSHGSGPSAQPNAR